ncbi:MAG TPA: hypothetical protein VKS79_18140, partial [Gemmataceae bacterium]|nr:hypothetical protein [Gemmataceae bacterium]
ELVIVAGKLTARGEQLRRALQSERHVLCVHPCAERLDRAYEAALIAEETKKLLLPLLPDGLDPTIAQLSQLIRQQVAAEGPFPLLRWERRLRSNLSEDQAFSNWDILRRLGGEIVELNGFAEQEGIVVERPLLAEGRFEFGGLFQLTLLPACGAENDEVVVEGKTVWARLKRNAAGSWSASFHEGNASLSPPVHSSRWSQLAQVIDSSLAGVSSSLSLNWQDEIRCLELDEALRRSIEKRRSSSMEYAEVSEEVSARGTITLIGCGMIWLMLLIFGLSIWLPWIRWLVVPMLIGFLVLLGARWVVERSKQ